MNLGKRNFNCDDAPTNKNGRENSSRPESIIRAAYTIAIMKKLGPNREIENLSVTATPRTEMKKSKSHSAR
jgi:hypothetical protein